MHFSKLHIPKWIFPLLLFIVTNNRVFTQDSPPPFPWHFVECAELDTYNPDAALSTLQSAGIDGAGNVYLTTYRVLGIHKHAPDGSWIANLGRRGSGPGEFQVTSYVAVSHSGDLMVYDGRAGRRLTRLSPDGSFIEYFHERVDIPSENSFQIGGADRYWISTISSIFELPRTRTLKLRDKAGTVLWIRDFAGVDPQLVERAGINLSAGINIPNPAAHDILWTVDPEGTAWILNEDQSQILCVSSSGVESEPIPTTLLPANMSSGDWNTYLDTVIGGLRESEIEVILEALDALEKKLKATRRNVRSIHRLWWVDSKGMLIDRLPYKQMKSGDSWPLVPGRYAALLSDGRMTEDIEGPGGLVAVSYGYALSLQSRGDELPKLVLYRLERHDGN